MHGSDLLTTIARVGFVVLVYGLWQGALIAFVTWGALQIFKSVNATTRYAVWSLALLAILIVPVATTLSRVHVSTPETMQDVHAVDSALLAASTSPAKSLPVTRIKPASASEPAAPKPTWFDNLRANLAAFWPKAYTFCTTLSTPVFATAFGLWLATTLVILIRLIVAFLQLERLKSDSLPLSVEFRDSMPRFSGAVTGERDIRICVSEKIEVPIAVGLFDSMVLLPSHLVHSLDAEEIDQISLHELCHLLRGDDWTNALQRIATGLLFFNPAMWFVSRQMDVEREVACDDYVLQLTGAVRPYAMCLTKMAEMTAWPHRALAAPGVFVTRKNISIRIERLLRTGRAIGSGLTLSVAGVVAAALLAVFFVLRTMTPTIAFTLPQDEASPAPPMKPTIGAKMIAPAKPVVPVAHAQNAMVQQSVQDQVRIELRNVPKGPTITIPAPKVNSVAQVAQVPKVAAVAKTALGAASTAMAQAVTTATGATVASAGCTGCNFAGADLSGRDFSHHSMEGSNFDRAKLRGAKFDGAQLTGSNFEDADLRGASFVNADLEGCNMRGAQLQEANFTGAHMTGCNIDAAGLSPEQTRMIMNACEGCNFEHANLRGMDLRGVHLTGTNLAHADLRDTNLSNVMFTGVNLEYANLAGAHVDGADFTGCNFAHVDLRGVDLSKASLTGSDMAHAIWQ